jgi:UPF0271 protein
MPMLLFDPGWAPLGDGALRMPRPHDVDPRALLERLRRWPLVVDVVVTEEHLSIHFDPAAPPADPWQAVAGMARASDAGPPTGREIAVAARYDGPDLAEVATRAGLSIDETIAIHAGANYTVAMIGFLPGFAYLRGIDERLNVPRLATPRTRVPAGAVGLAAGYTAVYPFGSPGGWNLVATAVGFAAFDPERGAALAIGDRVRFEPVG